MKNLELTATDIIKSDKKKKIIIIVSVLAAIIICVSSFLFYSWLHTFDKDDYKNMQWKRKYMYMDLVSQQDLIAYRENKEKPAKNNQYSLYYYSREEIKELLYNENTGKIPEDFTYTYKDKEILCERDSYYICTDNDGVNYWIVVQLRNGEIIEIDNISTGVTVMG
ncbi:MAG: hypothetical protein RR229_07790 [Oscillospiraceae bacterium]